MKRLIAIGFMIAMFGLIGHMDYVSEVETSRIDELNKQEVIKDMAIRCYKGDLPADMCKGL